PDPKSIPPDVLLARLGLDEVADQYPRDLSAGQRERVALAAILVMRPPLLLLDEPTRGLDYAQKRTLMEQLKQQQSEGTTVVVATHDVELVAQHADRVILLADGQIIADGPTRHVLTHAPPFAPQITRLFGHPGWLTVEDVVADVKRQT
ncbi:MAG: AAA family ATPase, partial [Ardenticatenaceae bacterium]